MEVIAQTGGGYLVQATKTELQEIINAVSGTRPEEIKIGQKIPAIDYAGTIKKIKSLKEDYNFKQLLQNSISVSNSINLLNAAVENASKLEI